MTPDDRYHFEPLLLSVESAITRGESVGQYHHSEIRRLLRAAFDCGDDYIAGYKAAARPATDPAGLDEEWLARALHYAALPEDYVAALPADYPVPLDLYPVHRIAAEYARLSVADGPGPEERPDWRAHLNAIRRLLVGSPPNADMIDAVIGYALNDCEAAIAAALGDRDPEERP